MIDKIDYLGIGLGYRQEIHTEIISHQEKIDFLEIIPEHFLYQKDYQKKLEVITSKFKVIPHAVELSLGNAMGIDKAYLKQLNEFIKFVDSPYWSEHISLSKTNAHDIGHLSPLPRNDDFLNLFVDNINRACDTIQKPLVIENITYMMNFSNHQYSEAEFINLLCERTNCGLLLDITNLYINSKNHGFNSSDFLQNLNTDNIVQYHIIGHEMDQNGYLIDGHGTAIQKGILDLFQHIHHVSKAKGIIIEWDKNFPENFDSIVSELDKVRTVWEKKA